METAAIATLIVSIGLFLNSMIIMGLQTKIERLRNELNQLKRRVG